MTETTQEQTGLASLLEDRLTTWEKARLPQTEKLLDCYQDVMRIPREDDTAGSGAARAKKAKGLFIGSTRNKVRAARAKIVDALLGAGKMPFDTTPTNEELAPFADVVEDILKEQLERGQYKTLLKSGVNTLATYGTGYTVGPLVRKEKIVEARVEKAGLSTQLVESVYEYDLPYFELCNTLDFVPDAEARSIEKGLGGFWVTMESRHTVKAWASDKSYKNIETALIGCNDNANENGSERASQMRANVDYWYKNDRIKVARFFGKVPKRLLDGAKPTEGEQEDGEMVDAVVIMAGGVVVKESASPYKKTPVQRCVYEAVEDEMDGVGVAENNAPHQKVTNAAFRLFMEGKGLALLGTKSVDRSKFLPTEDFKKFPGKTYQFKPGLSPDERKDAIINHIEPDITGGWIDVIRMSENFSDDDTGITKYTQGDDSGNLNKTASGISMIMSASSLPIKEVIQNIDSMWIEEHIELLLDWNLKYLEPETVEKIHGKEHAEKWAQIKEFGKTSFMDWQATGTSSFMQKEILTNKIRAFADFALSNPMTAQKIDVTEILQQTWDVMEIGRESPILKDDKGGIPPEMQQMQEQMKQQMQAMGTALENASKQVDELEAKLADKSKETQIKEFEAETKRLQATQTTDPNAIDPTAIRVAEINARSAEKIAMINKVSQVTAETPEFAENEATGEIEEKPSQTQVMLGALVESNQQLMQGLAVMAEAVSAVAISTSKPNNAQIRIEKMKDGSFVGQRIEDGSL